MINIFNIVSGGLSALLRARLAILSCSLLSELKFSLLRTFKMFACLLSTSGAQKNLTKIGLLMSLIMFNRKRTYKVHFIVGTVSMWYNSNF